MLIGAMHLGSPLISGLAVYFFLFFPSVYPYISLSYSPSFPLSLDHSNSGVSHAHMIVALDEQWSQGDLVLANGNKSHERGLQQEEEAWRLVHTLFPCCSVLHLDDTFLRVISRGM